MISISCKSTKKTVVAPTASGTITWTLQYDRGPCFGTCPVYTFYLLSNHNALIEVKANLLDPGWYYGQPDQEELQAILDKMDPEAWWHPDLSQEPEISDLPSHHLVYKSPSGERTLDIHSQINEDFSKFFISFNHLITETRWDTTSLRPQDFQVPSPLNLIVQMKGELDMEKWAHKYGQFGLAVKKRISPHQTYYLIAKDPAKGSSNDLYQALKRDPAVLGVQWDQETHQRGN